MRSILTFIFHLTGPCYEIIMVLVKIIRIRSLKTPFPWERQVSTRERTHHFSIRSRLLYLVPMCPMAIWRSWAEGWLMRYTTSSNTTFTSSEHRLATSWAVDFRLIWRSWSRQDLGGKCGTDQDRILRWLPHMLWESWRAREGWRRQRQRERWL